MGWRTYRWHRLRDWILLARLGRGSRLGCRAGGGTVGRVLRLIGRRAGVGCMGRRL